MAWYWRPQNGPGQNLVKDVSGVERLHKSWLLEFDCTVCCDIAHRLVDCEQDYKNGQNVQSSYLNSFCPLSLNVSTVYSRSHILHNDWAGSPIDKNAVKSQYGCD